MSFDRQRQCGCGYPVYGLAWAGEVIFYDDNPRTRDCGRQITDCPECHMPLTRTTTKPRRGHPAEIVGGTSQP